MKIILLLLITTFLGGCATPYIVMGITEQIKVAKQKEKVDVAIDTVTNGCKASTACLTEEFINEK